MPRRVWPKMAGAIVVLVGVLASLALSAEDDTCPSRCWEAYGVCYKSTSNRARCQSLLQRCLSNCIRAKRAPQR